jgi:hypothetical protein
VPILILILAVEKPIWEPNDEESGEVLNALCRHQPSAVAVIARPGRRRVVFSLETTNGTRLKPGMVAVH